MPIRQIEDLGITPPVEEFREELGIAPDRFRMIDATCEELPDMVEEHGIIIGGSPHSVTERLPWMVRLEEFIRRMDEIRKPMLGVCFGHQIIAQALGGTVEKGDQGRELGVVAIDLTEHGAEDPLFDCLDGGFVTAMSHCDVVTTLPAKARVLAKNRKYDHQALAVGDHIRSVQFHPEMSLPTLIRLALSRKDQLVKKKFVQDEAHLDQYLSSVRDCDVSSARWVLKNFFQHFAGVDRGEEDDLTGAAGSSTRRSY